ncbi:unnamed protein product [Lactuca virosa]|uniref:Uncharacterized protein n=1 Tax=Lactuca virosa TaxID=75947 RepID=A0AAU9M5J0_9ASTR|nr:unnamed protein product [Lactuca virosa]
MVIDVEGKELKVTTQSVHDMLGIPTSGTILTQLDQWPKDDISYDEWKQQFQERAIIRLNAIKKVIVRTTEADFNFKLNFLVLFINTFCESTSMGRCNMYQFHTSNGSKIDDEKEIEDKEGNGEEDNDNDGSQPEVDYFLDGNEAENEGIKNDGDNNKKEGETEEKEKNGEINEYENHEEKNDDETKETNNHGKTSHQNETKQNLLDKVI